jgi:hypothetical protein
MKQRLIALLLLAVMVVSVVSATAATTAAAPPKKLEKPKLVSPRNHAIVPLSPPTTFKWNAVRGTTSYRMELQKATRDTSNPSVIRWTGSARIISGASVGFGFAQLGAYRWRITALSSNPSLNSAPSNWRYFTVT